MTHRLLHAEVQDREVLDPGGVAVQLLRGDPVGEHVAPADLHGRTLPPWNCRAHSNS